MLAKTLTKVFGSRNSRLLKRLQADVAKINALEPAMAALSDDELRAKTEEFKSRYAQSKKLDELLHEAFAVVREASKRVLDMRHFDVQLIGGMVLHQGRIAEMRTGEGKTLVATLPVYLNALTGKGVHVVTVNDYLARRDAEWMGKIYRFLGMSVGVLTSGQEMEDKRAAYESDITYGTNNEYGFDYLRTNMAFHVEQRLQRQLHFAIVDEVDSILIDEARTPLIISGPVDQGTDLYYKINDVIPKLRRQQEEGDGGDFVVDEKDKQAYLTEAGHEKVEQLLAQIGLLKQGSDLYDAANLVLMQHLNAALRAHSIYNRDVDYIVKDGEVIIIDEFTGRMMAGRRWSEGLHQAVEAKEGLTIQRENQTLASITFQNYFRLYDKLAGMTGTADTEAFEFQQIYGLEVAVIPTHQPMVRRDMGDQIYRTKQEKYAAICSDIKEAHERGQPVLVGTISIENSEYLAELLRKANIPHQVLNAKYHEREAQIIAEAGRPGAVTIATNMAGRGTDIVLGGNLEAELENAAGDDVRCQRVKEEWRARHDAVIEAGGLHVVGTERHESRRIDNQLRGRSGRQGDPGSSRFYLSLEDDLMRIFGTNRISGILQRLGMEEGEAIEHRWITRAIENAQRKVEAHHFDIRKQLLEYDDISNEQRKVIYRERSNLMEAEDISENIRTIRAEVVTDVVGGYAASGSLPEQWDLQGLGEALAREFTLTLDLQKWFEENANADDNALREYITQHFEKAYEEKCQEYGESLMRQLERMIMLEVLDRQWKDHLAAMDHLRHGIGLRGYAQKNPKDEYKREAFNLFAQMLSQIRHEMISLLTRVRIRSQEEVDQLAASQPADQDMQFIHASASAPQPQAGRPATPAQKPVVRQTPKVGRNDPCPCGSGKKYKKCHGQQG